MVCICRCSVVTAQVVVYDVTSASGDEATFSATTTGSGVTALDLTRGAGLTASSGVGSFNSKAFTTATSIDTADYLSFGIQSSTSPVSLGSVSLTLRRSGTGPDSFSLFSDKDNFVTSIGNLSLPDDAEHAFTVNVNNSTFANISDVEFRLFGYNAGSSVGTGRVGALSLSAVPEPEEYAFFMSMCLVVWVVQRRYRKHS